MWKRVNMNKDELRLKELDHKNLDNSKRLKYSDELKVNHLMNFAEIADDYSKKHKYKNLLSTLRESCFWSHDKHYSISDKFKPSQLIEQEVNTLQETIDKEHYLTNIVNQLTLLLSIQYDYHQCFREGGDYGSDFEDATLFLGIPLSFPIENIADENVSNKIISFYKEFPTLYSGELKNIQKDINSDKELCLDIKDYFFKHYFERYEMEGRYGNTQEQLTHLPYHQPEIMDFFRENKKFNSLLSEYIKFEYTKGSKGGGEFGFCVSQPYLVAKLKTTDLITLMIKLRNKK
jgi:hypothetical protein